MDIMLPNKNFLNKLRLYLEVYSHPDIQDIPFSCLHFRSSFDHLIKRNKFCYKCLECLSV